MSNATKRTILAFGTFDLLHPGHRSFLRQAKRLGHRLIVAVGRDHVVKQLKGRTPVHPEQKRLQNVRRLPFVWKAVLASRQPRHRFAFIRKHQPHTIALGYDQRHYTRDLAAGLKRHGLLVRIVRLKPFQPHRHKTSLRRARLDRRSGS